MIIVHSLFILSLSKNKPPLIAEAVHPAICFENILALTYQ